MPTPAPTQITLDEELERTEGSKAYPHQFKKAQISNRTIRCQGGARLETLRHARWERHAGGGQAHEALAVVSFKVRRDVLSVLLFTSARCDAQWCRMSDPPDGPNKRRQKRTRTAQTRMHTRLAFITCV
jgi:hypothetical protein